ncbi:MAG: M56 family metallopeptidase [Vicinamibacteria bacterium]
MRMLLMTAMASLAAGALCYIMAALYARLAGRGNAFLRRLLPLAGLLLGMLVLMAPAFLLHEPAQADERPGVVASALAAFGLLLLGATAARAVRTFRATRRLVAEWSRDAQPIALPGQPVPAFGIVSAFPVVAVVGVFRPRLFIARRVLQALTPDELQAVLAHEAWHVRAGDNVKRWLMACAPTIGFRPLAARLEREWEEAMEIEADRGAGGALELASALVKTARLAPPGADLRVPAAAFHGGGSIARRIDRLVRGSRADSGSRRGLRVAAVAAVVAVAASLPALWPMLHRAGEAVLHLP